MRRNVTGQFVGCQLIAKADGTPITTGTTTVYVTGDAGSQAAGSVGSGACTHEGNGFWTYAPAQAETNYTHVAFTFVNTNAINATVQIYPIAYDASGQMTGVTVASGGIAAASFAAGAINAAAIADGAIDAATFAAGAITATVIATGAIDADALAADTITAAKVATDVGTEIAAAVWDMDATTHQTQGTFGQAIGDPAADANTIYGAVVTGAAGATVAADIVALQTSVTTVDDLLDTEIPALTTELAKIPKSDGSVIFNATCVGNIKSGLSTQAELDKVPKSDGTVTWNATALGSIQSECTDALNAYDGPTNAELATALGTADDAVLTAIGDLPTNSELATALGTADDAVLAAIGALNDLSATEVADAVWDAVIASHLDVGSTGAALAAAGGAGDPWITPLPGAYISGQAGYIVGTNLNATVSSRATQTSVDDIPTNAELATALGTADDAVLTAIGDLPTNAELATALGTADDAVLTALSNGTVVLHADYNAAKTAASQTSVNDIPTNAELATALGTADDATLAAIADVQARLPAALTGNGLMQVDVIRIDGEDSTVWRE